MNVSRRAVLSTGFIVSAAGLALLTGCREGRTREPEPPRLRRLGWLSATTLANDTRVLTLIREEMAKLGWVEGEQYVIEYRFAEGAMARLPELTADLIGQRVELIMTINASTIAAAEAARSVPVVMFAGSSDPIGQGLAQSLARPGGNVTGIAGVAPHIWNGKQIEVLKEALPALEHVGVLWDARELGPYARAGADLPSPVLRRTTAAGIRSIEDAAGALGLRLHVMEVDHTEDFAAAFARARDLGVEGVFISLSERFVLEAQRIADLSVEYRLPAITSFLQFARAGLLLVYRTSFEDIGVRGAWYLDQILKGAAPGELPIYQPSTFELIVNLKTAYALGVTIAPDLLARATNVIR